MQSALSSSFSSPSSSSPLSRPKCYSYCHLKALSLLSVYHLTVIIIQHHRCTFQWWSGQRVYITSNAKCYGFNPLARSHQRLNNLTLVASLDEAHLLRDRTGLVGLGSLVWERYSCLSAVWWDGITNFAFGNSTQLSSMLSSSPWMTSYLVISLLLPSWLPFFVIIILGVTYTILYYLYQVLFVHKMFLK